MVKSTNDENKSSKKVIYAFKKANVLRGKEVAWGLTNILPHDKDTRNEGG